MGGTRHWRNVATLALCTTTGCTITAAPNNRAQPPRRRHQTRAVASPMRVAPTPAPRFRVAASRPELTRDGRPPTTTNLIASLLPPQPERAPPAPNPAEPQLLPEDACEGRPRGFRPDAPAAFWVWQGPRGGWRVRTTAAKKLHTFTGRVRGTTGAIVNVHPSRPELREQLWPEQQRRAWAFAFRSQSHAEGFTFFARDGGCVQFDLRDGDGGTMPIFVGRREHQPGSSHFIACPPGTSPDQSPPSRRRRFRR